MINPIYSIIYTKKIQTTTATFQKILEIEKYELYSNNLSDQSYSYLLNLHSIVDLHNLISSRLSEHRLKFFINAIDCKINKLDLKKVFLIFCIRILQYLI